MKKLLLLCLPLALLFACAEDKGHDTKLEFNKDGDGLVITHAADTFASYQKKYTLTVTVKNNGKETAENGVVKAGYYDREDDMFHETSTIVKKPLPAGDSVKVEVVSDINTKSEVPYRVKITVGDMFN